MSDSAAIADLVVRNGRIYTVDRERPWADAMAVLGGRIVAIGAADEVAPHIGPQTRILDLGGRMAMPGIVDVHAHTLLGGLEAVFEIQFANTARLDAILEKVQAAAQAAPEGAWLVGSQWGSDLFSVLNTAEALARLDAASLGRPVLLWDDTHHNRWVNSAALKLAGVTADTADPEQGSFGRDPQSGALTGLVVEAAVAQVERALLDSGYYHDEKDRTAMAHAIATLNAYGVTAVLDAAAMAPVLTSLKGLDDRGLLTAWVGGAMPVMEPAFMFGASGEELFAQRESFRSAHVRPDFAKVFLDGVPGARTAAFHEPYTPDPVQGCCFRGTTLASVPELVRWMGRCEKLGLAVKIHCAGDAAVTQALDAIDVVRSFNGPTDLIHHIAHASYIAPADIPRFAELGVAADLSPFIWYPTAFLQGHKQTMGEARATRFWPNRDLKQAGALMAGGSDWPVIPNPDPWNGMEGLVTRQNPAGDYPGESLWPEQALDIETVVEIFTINAAKVMGMDRTIGSLRAGKSADFIVLDRNLLEIPADEIADIRVLETWFEGRKVHQREQAA